MLEFLRDLPALKALALPKPGMLQSFRRSGSDEDALIARLAAFRSPKCDLDARLQAQEARVATLVKWQQRLEGVEGWFRSLSSVSSS